MVHIKKKKTLLKKKNNKPPPIFNTPSSNDNSLKKEQLNSLIILRIIAQDIRYIENSYLKWYRKKCFHIKSELVQLRDQDRNQCVFRNSE